MAQNPHSFYLMKIFQVTQAIFLAFTRYVYILLHLRSAVVI